MTKAATMTTLSLRDFVLARCINLLRLTSPDNWLLLLLASSDLKAFSLPATKNVKTNANRLNLLFVLFKWFFIFLLHRYRNGVCVSTSADHYTDERSWRRWRRMSRWGSAEGERTWRPGSESCRAVPAMPRCRSRELRTAKIPRWKVHAPREISPAVETINNTFFFFKKKAGLKIEWQAPWRVITKTALITRKAARPPNTHFSYYRIQRLPTICSDRGHYFCYDETLKFCIVELETPCTFILIESIHLF